MTENQRMGQANWLTIVAVLCAVASTAVVVRRELVAEPTLPQGRGRVAVELVRDRASVENVGHLLGRPDAPLALVVFSDLECPACGWFATKVYPDLKSKYGDQISLRFRHWPLKTHKFAYPAARAAECAATQGRFQAFHDAVFSEQKLLGLKPFVQVAKESGVPDIAAFAACAADTNRVESIERDMKAVLSIGGAGTPTLVLNGWQFVGGAGFTKLDSVANSLLRGATASLK